MLGLDVAPAGCGIDPEAGANLVSFTPPDVDLLPEPTIYRDPEAKWSAQHEGGAKKIFVIRYQNKYHLHVQECAYDLAVVA